MAQNIFYVMDDNDYAWYFSNGKIRCAVADLEAGEENGYHCDSLEEGVALLKEYGYITDKKVVIAKARVFAMKIVKKVSNYFWSIKIYVQLWYYLKYHYIEDLEAALIRGGVAKVVNMRHAKIYYLLNGGKVIINSDNLVEIIPANAK